MSFILTFAVQMKHFLVRLFFFSLIAALADYCWNEWMTMHQVPRLWLILIFFVIITLLFHLLTLKAAKGRPQNFIRFYMGSTALKMAICVITILVYRFIDKPTVIPFALAFLAHYFFFSIFEVVILLRQLKQ